jgi:hypothetical protein
MLHREFRDMDSGEPFYPNPTSNRQFIGWTLPDRADYEERAAILEYEGGLPREEANRRAYEIVEADIEREFRKRHEPMWLAMGFTPSWLVK